MKKEDQEFCKKCGGLIGDHLNNEIHYNHFNKKGKPICITCEHNRREKIAGTSFYIIVSGIIVAFLLLKIFVIKN